MDFLNVGEGVEQQEERDVVGGFVLHESDIQPVSIKAAFYDKSANGANCITLLLEGEEGFKYTHNEYLTNRKGENFYIDKKDKKTKHLLPGMNLMMSFSKMITGVELKDAPVEDKFHEIYSKTLGQKTPQERATLVDWQGVKIEIAILKIHDNKQVKNSDGKYINCPTGADMTTNEIDKFLTEDGLTANEKAKGTASKYKADWLAENKGKTREKYTAIPGGSATAGAPVGAASTKPLNFDE